MKEVVTDENCLWGISSFALLYNHTQIKDKIASCILYFANQLYLWFAFETLEDSKSIW